MSCPICTNGHVTIRNLRDHVKTNHPKHWALLQLHGARIQQKQLELERAKRVCFAETKIKWNDSLMGSIAEGIRPLNPSQSAEGDVIPPYMITIELDGSLAKTEIPRVNNRSGKRSKISDESVLRVKYLKDSGVSWKEIMEDTGVVWGSLQYAYKKAERIALTIGEQSANMVTS